MFAWRGFFSVLLAAASSAGAWNGCMQCSMRWISGGVLEARLEGEGSREETFGKVSVGSTWEVSFETLDKMIPVRSVIAPIIKGGTGSGFSSRTRLLTTWV